MKQLKAHVATLSKVQLDTFASEFYGIKLDRRNTKADMTKAFLSEAKDTTPLKQLPWEELLVEEVTEPVVETPEVTEPVVETPEVTEPVVETPETPEVTEPVVETPETPEVTEPVVETDDTFTPIKLPFKNGGVPFVAISHEMNTLLKSILAGDADVKSVPAQSQSLIKSLLWYIEETGSVMIRETRNSRFITYKKG